MKISHHHRVVSKRRSAILSRKARTYTDVLKKYAKQDTNTIAEASLFIAGDLEYHKSIHKALKRFDSVRHVILVGIGGSSLGTEALYAALSDTQSPKLTVIDSVSAEEVVNLETCIKESDIQEIVLVVVSKSGTTTETMLNAVKVMDICEKKYGKLFYGQTIFIGDADTAFLKLGEKNNILCFAIPKSIGGRYSIFTAVGIVPLTLLGIDVDALRKGARAVFTQKSLKQIETNALTLALHAEEGVHTVNFFTFNKRLEVCGYWYRQLLAESIGKNMTTKGTSFQYQLLPIVSSSVDLHSMAQLYLGGYKHLYTHFVHYTESFPYHVRAQHWLIEHMTFLRKTTFGRVRGAITKGVLRAYDDQKLPYRVTELSKCDAYELGLLLATLMAETMYLAYLLDVNPFDQPSVELYKKHMRTALNIS